MSQENQDHENVDHESDEVLAPGPSVLNPEDSSVDGDAETTSGPDYTVVRTWKEVLIETHPVAVVPGKVGAVLFFQKTEKIKTKDKNT